MSWLRTHQSILSSCADYIQVIRSGGFGVTESCGNITGDNANQLEGRMLCMHLLVVSAAIAMNIS